MFQVEHVAPILILLHHQAIHHVFVRKKPPKHDGCVPIGISSKIRFFCFREGVERNQNKKCQKKCCFYEAWNTICHVFCCCPSPWSIFPEVLSWQGWFIWNQRWKFNDLRYLDHGVGWKKSVDNWFYVIDKGIYQYIRYIPIYCLLTNFQYHARTLWTLQREKPTIRTASDAHWKFGFSTKKNDERRSVHLVQGFSFPKRKKQHSLYKNVYIYLYIHIFIYTSFLLNSIYLLF